MVDILQVLSSPLGQRILAIYFTSTSLSTLLTFYSERYLYNKYIMPYLRGTKKAAVAKFAAPTIRNELDRLKRQVARNTASPDHFIRIVPLQGEEGVEFHRIDIPFTTTFTTDAKYRDSITGDKYYNNWIKLKFHSINPACNALRVVVYSPKVTTAEFIPEQTVTGFVTPPDPAAFRVYYDQMIQNPNSLQPLYMQRLVNLRKTITEFNGSSNILERGNIRICLLVQNSSSQSLGFLGYQLCTTDK